MSEHDDRETFSTTVSGNVSGHIATGHHIVQSQGARTTTVTLTDADRAQLDELLAELRATVAAEAPADKRDAAVERVDELAATIKAEKPDVSTIEYVRNWFGRHIPALAGAVVSVVVHPIVGKAVEAAGDLVSDEFRRRFGHGAPSSPS